jgi:hypothetical protein
MIDVTSYRLNFRGYPVTLVSDGVASLLSESSHGPDCDLSYVLRQAHDTAQPPDEPSGWYFTSQLAGQTVSIERFGKPAMWSVFLTDER